jgi:hypothetical protein
MATRPNFLQLLETLGNFWKPLWKGIEIFGRLLKEIEIAPGKASV